MFIYNYMYMHVHVKYFEALISPKVLPGLNLSFKFRISWKSNSCQQTIIQMKHKRPL